MKTLSIIMINLLLFSFSINGTSQKNETNNIKTNLDDLVFENQLYFHEGELFTGSFYNTYSSNGPNSTNNDSYAEGAIRNGKRDGVWSWYCNNTLTTRRVYNDGELSTTKGDNFNIVNGKKCVYLN